MATSKASTATIATINSWQTEFAKEYKRTSGNSASFGEEQSGGWYTVTSTGDGAPLPGRHQLQKVAVIAKTERLRMRESYAVAA